MLVKMYCIKPYKFMIFHYIFNRNLSAILSLSQHFQQVHDFECVASSVITSVIYILELSRHFQQVHDLEFIAGGIAVHHMARFSCQLVISLDVGHLTDQLVVGVLPRSTQSPVYHTDEEIHAIIDCFIRAQQQTKISYNLH